MASHPEIVQSCIDDAATAARSALAHCIDDAVAALQIGETQSMRVAERDQMAAAWRDLLKNKAGWSEQYAARLLEAFNHGIAATAQATLLVRSGIGVSPPPGASAFGALSRESFSASGFLSLVDDDHVSQAIESSRLLQAILPAVDQTLAALNKLMSSAQGLPNVRPELNPLRPEVFADTLRALIFSASAESEISTLWIRHLSPPLGRQIKLLYERIVNKLEMANVQEATYRVVQTASGLASRGTGGRGSPAGGTGGPGEGAGNRAGAIGANGGDGGYGRYGANDVDGGDGVAGRGNGKGKTGLGAGKQPGGGAGSAFGYVSDEPIVRKPSQYADLSHESVNNELFQDFLLRGGASAEHGLAPAYYDNIEEELRALKAGPDSVQAAPEDVRTDPPSASGYEDMPVGDRPPRKLNARSELSQKVWGAFGRRKERAIVATELKKKAKRVGQVMGLEVVRQLVNQVAQDPRLLSPVREGIVALEPSLLRLAMVDPRFFSDEGHPGRRLMERVAQRSFKYNDDRSAEFGAFFEPVKSAFNALNRLTISDAQPFRDALAGLENGWEQQDEEETARRNAVLQALRFAEERQGVADQIAFDLSNRSDLDDVPGLVLDFLFGPWALAMAHARLTDTRNQIDPRGLGLVVPDLVWSAKRQMTMRQPAKLIEMIPGLLTRLHGGLELLDQDPRESEAFFEALMRIHQPVLKLRRLKSQRDAEESANAPLEPEEMPATPEQRRAKVATQPWLGREDRAAAGFDDVLSSQNDDLRGLQDDEDLSVSPLPSAGDSEQTESDSNDEIAANAVDGANASNAGVSASPDDNDPPDSANDTEGSSDAEAILLALRSGAWVDLFYRRRWLRAQLVWASGKGTLFMFVSHGGRAHSMTRRTCERLIREQLLRPVNSQGVVAQALDAVVNEAAAKAVP